MITVFRFITHESSYAFSAS